MKIIALLVSLFIYAIAFGQEDYTININDTTIKISLDKKYDITIGGEKIKFYIVANDTLDFNDNIIGFKYTKNFKLTKTDLGQGIEQTMLMTAKGSGIIIQKYSTINPMSLNEIMLREVTKESLSYGYEMVRADYNFRLKTGQNIKIDKAILKYKDETNIYEVTTIGKKDEGILIITLKMDDEKENEGQKLISLMWDTLVIK